MENKMENKMELIEVAKNERLISDGIIKTKKVELFKVRGFYLIIYSWCYNYKHEFVTILSETYSSYDDAASKFDRIVNIVFED